MGLDLSWMMQILMHYFCWSYHHQHKHIYVPLLPQKSMAADVNPSVPNLYMLRAWHETVWFPASFTNFTHHYKHDAIALIGAINFHT
jgi:hypothetical protein